MTTKWGLKQKTGQLPKKLACATYRKLLLLREGSIEWRGHATHECPCVRVEVEVVTLRSSRSADLDDRVAQGGGSLQVGRAQKRAGNTAHLVGIDDAAHLARAVEVDQHQTIGERVALVCLQHVVALQ